MANLFIGGFILCLLTGIVLVITKQAIIFGKLLLSIVFVVTACFIAMFGGILISLYSVFVFFYAIVFAVFIFLLCIFLLCWLWNVARKKIVFIPITVGIAGCFLTASVFWGYQAYIRSIPTVDDGENLLFSYEPYADGTKVALLDDASNLVIENDIPKLDGATALYPIYSAFARAVYPKNILEEEDWNYLTCSTTAVAYEKIVTGAADIIFVAGPSYEQTAFAEECGVELVYTPIGKEAFVFFVNSKNPLTNITLDQIKEIYTGKITQWSELHVDHLGEIRAFQRDEGSGSQTALERLIGSQDLIVPPRENIVSAMGGIISRTADYKNYKNAIGYSFRFYATEMVKNNQIRLLKINGIDPNLENIENGTYPIASEFYAVTRKSASENTQKMLQWIISEQGQELIQKTGYTPIRQ